MVCPRIWGDSGVSGDSGRWCVLSGSPDRARWKQFDSLNPSVLSVAPSVLPAFLSRPILPVSASLSLPPTPQSPSHLTPSGPPWVPVSLTASHHPMCILQAILLLSSRRLLASRWVRFPAVKPHPLLSRHFKAAAGASTRQSHQSLNVTNKFHPAGAAPPANHTSGALPAPSAHSRRRSGSRPAPGYAYHHC